MAPSTVSPAITRCLSGFLAMSVPPEVVSLLGVVQFSQHLI
jgi:hypothetical protein